MLNVIPGYQLFGSQQTLESTSSRRTAPPAYTLTHACVSDQEMAVPSLKPVSNIFYVTPAKAQRPYD